MRDIKTALFSGGHSLHWNDGMAESHTRKPQSTCFEEISVLLKHKLICTSEHNFQHQHATHCPRDGRRQGSVWHVRVAVHVGHHYVARVTGVGGPLVVQASIRMLSWGIQRAIKDASTLLLHRFFIRKSASKTGQPLHKIFVYKIL